jgi:hypothetical protein
MTQLTKHFSLDELTHSDVAVRRGIDNTPPADVRPSLSVLADGLERVRAVLDSPLFISSGYRCPKLNSTIGGSKTSAHMKGLAADFTAPEYGPPDEIIVEMIAARHEVIFDQAILEFGRWVHVAFAGVDERPRMQVLSYDGQKYERIA